MTELHYLDLLIGKRIVDVSQEVSMTIPINDPDPQKVLMEIPILLSFDQYSLSVYNTWALVGEAIRTDALIGREIRAITLAQKWLLIDTDGGVGLRVDMSDDGFIGPEVLVLHGPNNLCVVWN